MNPADVPVAVSEQVLKQGLGVGENGAWLCNGTYLFGGGSDLTPLVA